MLSYFYDTDFLFLSIKMLSLQKIIETHGSGKNHFNTTTI